MLCLVCVCVCCMWPETRVSNSQVVSVNHRTGEACVCDKPKPVSMVFGVCLCNNNRTDTRALNVRAFVIRTKYLWLGYQSRAALVATAAAAGMPNSQISRRRDLNRCRSLRCAHDTTECRHTGRWRQVKIVDRMCVYKCVITIPLRSRNDRECIRHANVIIPRGDIERNFKNINPD